MINPTTGMPTIAAAIAESAMLSRPRKRRRSGLNASPRPGSCVSLGMQQFSHPLANGNGHQDQPGGRKYIRTEYSKKQKRYAKREEHRRVGRRRYLFRQRRVPLSVLFSMRLRSLFE